MLVGIYDLKDCNGQEIPFLGTYEAILAFNGIPHVRLDVHQPDFWEKVRDLDLFLMRWVNHDSHQLLAHDVLPIIEQHLKIPCYPNQKTCWHYDDKVRQYLLMRAHGFPMTPCQVFWSRREAMQWLEMAELPTVFKLRSGAGSHNVVLVKSRAQGGRLIRKMFGRGIKQDSFLAANNIRFQHFSLGRELHHLGGNLYRWGKGLDVSPQWRRQKNYVLFQQFLPNNRFDTRVTVIGARAFAFRRFNRPGDFRASGSGRIDPDVSQIDLRCVAIAHQVSAGLGFQSMAYDFLFNENHEPEFCEISYDYLSNAVYNCPGYWDPLLHWHEGHFWPEHLQLMDALDRPDLKVPEING